MSVLVRMNSDGLTVLDGFDARHFNRRGEYTGIQEKYNITRIRGFLALPVLSLLQTGTHVDVMLFENNKQTSIRTNANPTDLIMALQLKGNFVRMVYQRGIFKTENDEEVRYTQTMFIYRAGYDVRPILRSLGCTEASS